MKIKRFVDTQNYMLFFTNDLTSKVETVNTISTSVTLEYFALDFRIYVLDFLIGIKYIDEAFVDKNIKLKVDGDYLHIYFTEIEEGKVDIFDGDGEEVVNENVKIYLNNWNVTKISIRKDFLPQDFIDSVVYE